MATYNTRKIQDLPALHDDGHEAAFNDLLDRLCDAGVIVHHEYKSADQVTAANASDLATSKTLATALALAVVAHGADTDIHTTADAALVQAAAWSSAPSEPADLAEVGAVLNELKTDINLHVLQTDHHRGQVWGGLVTDGVLAGNVIATADYTSTQGEANTLANAIKAFLNAHAKSGAASIERVSS